MLFQKSLASFSTWSLCFVLPPRICLPEYHRNIVASSTAEKVLHFQFPCSPLRGNQRDGGKEFTIAEGTVKAVCDTCRLQTCRLALGLAKLELVLAKLALRIGIGI